MYTRDSPNRIAASTYHEPARDVLDSPEVERQEQNAEDIGHDGVRRNPTAHQVDEQRQKFEDVVKEGRHRVPGLPNEAKLPPREPAAAAAAAAPSHPIRTPSPSVDG